MATNATNERNDTTVDGFDRGIVPAETAARKEREGDAYKSLPDNPESSDTSSGYTVDSEGLLNNYATEPEMYVEGGSSSSDPNLEEAQQAKQQRDAARGLAKPRFGFTEYAENLNGRLAMFGFTLCVVTELLTGQGMLSQLGIL
ncbi:chlorophyll a/b-binding protein [Synechococcus sp. PCC 7336]|uniref:chlorophyll a/b-binding protein n=1 Tax=Synechococcus sp. PCC 7336 TaxID=195250 RepID=UPI0003486CAA|nr:chlorophyll a/b-binding protein [Synechococcus sp. PCC 7336]